MGFGNIGIGELMMILLVVMLVFGPKRLPEIARNMGKFMRDFRRETNAAIKELKDGIEPVKVGIFDEPDSMTGTAPDNGAASSPGAAAAAGVPVMTPPTEPLPANGGRKASPKRKPARRAAPSSTARRKSPSSTTSRAKTTGTKKGRASKPKKPATRSGSARKR